MSPTALTREEVVTELRARAKFCRMYPERWVRDIPRVPLTYCALYDMDINGILRSPFTQDTRIVLNRWYHSVSNHRTGAALNLVTYNDTVATSAADIAKVLEEAANWYESHDE